MLLALVPVLSSQASYAEDVTFVVPGSKDPSLEQFFDPALQIIEKGQAIVFVNPDPELHNLVIKSNADGKQVFDTGELQTNEFVSYNFSDYGPSLMLRELIITLLDHIPVCPITLLLQTLQVLT